jgi:DNA-binding response OmpR family regulator
MVRILVVHEEPVSLDLTCNALQAPEFRIIGTCDAREALALMRRDIFDLVLTDLEMRPINGVELLRRMNRSKIDIPVLFISGPTVIAKVIAASRGSNALVERPFTAATLRRRVVRFLANSQHDKSNPKEKPSPGGRALKGGASVPSVRNLFIHRIS